MKIRTNLLERFVKFLDNSLGEHARFENTKTKNNTYFKLLKVFLLIISPCFYLIT